MSINKSQFITVAEMAKMLGITRAAINKQILEDKMPAEKVGRNYLIPKTALPIDLQERIRKGQKEATKSVIEKSHHHDLDFEKELWAAADKLRGNIDVSEYKNIVLGLLFLKYISDAFYKRREELDTLTRNPKNEDFYVKDDKARAQILETKDFYKSAGVFYVPEKSRWEYLQTKTMQSDIGQVLDKAMDLIEEDNRAELEGVLPKIYTRTTLDHAVIGELVNIFSRISFDHDFDREKDILGRIYEYFLGQFASSEGKRGGEFFTPRSIVKLLVEILEPYENARVLDPACGSGGMFVAMGEYLRNHGQDASKLAINGQESNQTTLRLAKMNLAIRGLSGKIELGNSYYQDKFPHLQADFVIANPPFNAEWEPSKLADSDPRITLGTPPSGNANFMWIQHFAHHIAPNGHAGFVMSNGAFGVSGREGDLRQKLIETDLVDVIISCPSKLFYNVSLPVSLWFLAKNKSGDRFRKRAGETLFIDARDIFDQISRKQVAFNSQQVERISNTVRAWRGEKGSEEYKDIPGYCKASTIKEISVNGYVLTPSRYVGSIDEEDDGVSMDERLKKITDYLRDQTLVYKKLDEEISKNLSEYYPNQNWENINYSSPAILENLASCIFTDWFIRFQFPGSEKLKFIESKLGKMPEGWEISRINNFGEVVCGKTPSKANSEYFGGHIPFIKIPDMHGQTFIMNTEDSLTDIGADTQRNKFIPEGSICVSCIATVGLVSITTKDSQTNQQINSVVPTNKHYLEFLYFSLLNKRNELIGIGSGGSTTLNVNTSVFSNIEIMKPSEEILQSFHSAVSKLFEKIKQLSLESSIVKKTGDSDSSNLK